MLRSKSKAKCSVNTKLQQSQNSSSTLDKLHNLRPLREQQQQQSNGNLTRRDKTPIRDKLKQDIKAQSNALSYNQGKSLSRQKSSSRNANLASVKNNMTMTQGTIDCYSSIDSHQYISNSTQKLPQQYQQQQIKVHSSQSKHRLNKHLAVFENSQEAKSFQQQIESDNIKVYQVKSKKSGGLMRSNNHQQVKEQFDQSQISRRSRSRSKDNKLSQIQSKVKQNLQSKTPTKGPGALLSQRHCQEQQMQLQRRNEEIAHLENELFQIKNNMQFQIKNKDQMYEHIRKTSGVRRQQTTDSDCLDSSSTDESTHTHKVQSKKQFSDLELLIKNHQFSENSLDRVFLKICGFTDLKEQTQQLIENKKDYQLVAAKKQPMQQMMQDEVITGSVTFFEKRSEKMGVVSNVSSNYNSEVPDEYHYQQKVFTVEKKKEQPVQAQLIEQNNQIEIQEQEEQYPDSPTQIRKIYEFGENDNSNKQSLNCDSFLASLKDDEFLRKREEIRKDNQKLVEDFDKVFQQVIEQRKTASNLAFYEALHEYDYSKKQLDTATFRDTNGLLTIAESPTKRLICMKNSSVEHIQQLKDRNLLSNRQPNQKTQIYLASPERAYIVKSDQKKLDYNLAYKKPLQFQDQVLNQPISKHKIQQMRTSLSPKESRKQSTLGSNNHLSQSSQKNARRETLSSIQKKKKNKDHEVFTIVTKNNTQKPHNKINQKIKQKIEQKLADKFGASLTQQVLQALEEANIQDAISELLERQQSDNQNTQLQRAISVKSLPINQELLTDNAIFESGSIGDKNSHNNLQVYNKSDIKSQRLPTNREFKGESNMAIGVYNGSQSQRSRLSNYQHQ